MDRSEAMAYLLSRQRKNGPANSNKRRNKKLQIGPRPQYTMEQDAIVEALHHKDITEDFLKTLKDIATGDAPPRDAFEKAVVPALFEMMTQLKTSSSEKQRADIAKEFLDRAGYGKIQKSHVGVQQLGAHSSDEELTGAILGLLEETRIGKVVDVEPEDS